MAKKENSYKISGRVLDNATGAGLKGLRVEAWDEDLMFDDFVGSAVTGADGAFIIEFDAGHFAELFLDRRPDLYFKVLRDGETVADTKGAVLWNARAGDVPVAIAVEAPASGGHEADAPPYTVAGTVASLDRGGAAGLRVEIVDKNVGQDVPLASAVTGERGRYSARFKAQGLSARGKRRPDLQARAYAGQQFLAASEVRYDAGAEETLNVLLPSGSAALPSEYETLTRALSAHFGGRLGDLRESGGRQDVTYLANKTGWDARAVALAALADRFAREGAEGERIPAAFYYALFRAGLPADRGALYRTDARAAARVWTRAVEQGVIPRSLGAEVEQAAAAFQRLGAAHSLDARALAGASTLKEMLSLSLGEDAQRQRQFADLYARHRRDLPKFWGEVEQAFGGETARRLRLDGQLGYLTLNNAPLVGRLHEAEAQAPLSSTLDLARRGYFRSEKWQGLLEGATPEHVPGATPEERRANYAGLLAAQVRLSFPTAVVAAQVRGGELALRADASAAPEAAAEVRAGVNAFFEEHQGEFEISAQPVEQYVAHKGLAGQVAPPVLEEVTRIQRVYQLTTDDESLKGLLRNDLDSAYEIVRYDEEEFVQSFAAELGGAEKARRTYAKSQQVHNAVLNIVAGYAARHNSIPLGSGDGSQFILAPGAAGFAGASDVIAYPTLEELFGSQDYCACDHCRSVLSPAAYLVDLLQFIDRPVNKGENPQAVLFERRPDIQFLKLTCENTNTPLPYIDVVNEALEHFVTHGLSLAAYHGHDTGEDASAEELLASPRFVTETAYDTLKGARFPGPLPFHDSLETLRRYFAQFGFPLPAAMEALRAGDALERAGGAGSTAYGWRDILMERLGLSRQEYRLLTDGDLIDGNPPDGAGLTVRELYGYPEGTPAAQLLDELSHVRTFARRVGVTYEEIVEILKTRFVNPGLALVPRLLKLGLSFEQLKDYRDGKMSDGQLDAALPKGLNPKKYGGDIKAWIKNKQNSARLLGLITIVDTSAKEEGEDEEKCDFETMEFRYTDPDDGASRLGRFEFVRLIRFIRLWKKLGWTIEQTDQALAALYPAESVADASSSDASNLKRLDAGFLVLLPRLGVVTDVLERLGLSAGRDLAPLLACWSDIDTASLYRQMFLSPTLPKQAAGTDPFAADAYGDFLPPDGNAQLVAHAETLRAAFNLTAEEFEEIVEALTAEDNQNAPPKTTPLKPADLRLTLGNVSRVYRRGWLARKLRLSVREFLLLTRFTGIDPFAPPDVQAAVDDPHPPLVRLLRLAEALKAASLKPTQALYLIWNQDISGQSAPGSELFRRSARALRSDFASVESEYVVADDPNGDIARARMALVYGAEAADLFFGLLGDALSPGVAYTQPQATLAQPLVDAARARLSYDAARQTLTYLGIMRAQTRDALKAAAVASADFKQAVDELYKKNQEAVGRFFARGGKLFVAVVYKQPQPALDKSILDAAPGAIAYDHAGQRLTYNGFLGDATRDALKAAAGADANFKQAVDKLYEENQKAVASSFPRNLGGTLAVDVAYSQPQASLAPDILDAAPGRIAYDDLRKRLSFSGPLGEETRDALKAAAGAGAAFKLAVDKLYAANQAAVGPFFKRYPELLQLQREYAASPDAPEEKRTRLLEHFLPELKRRRKRQQALASAAATAGADDAFTRAVLDDAAVLHAAGAADRPALDDLTALETQGLSASFFWADAAFGVPNLVQEAAPSLDYTTDANRLPDNQKKSGAPVSGVWRGYLEAPESGPYNISIEADDGAAVKLSIDGRAVALAHADGVWSNQEEVSLTAGTLHLIILTVNKTQKGFAVRWEASGRGREVIPARYLYPVASVRDLRDTSTRFLKAAALAAALKLTAGELSHFAAHDDYKIGGAGWLNALPTAGGPDAAKAAALGKSLAALLDFARLKAELSPDDERLLALLRDPAATLPNGEGLLPAVTGWRGDSVGPLLKRFFGSEDAAALKRVENFRRVRGAYVLVSAFGLSAAALADATTNEPTPAEVRKFHSALRARYDASDWLAVLKPISDELRALRRDALVAYVLRRMGDAPATEHIDTPEKLFEYFLMDVQMEPCMQTSRIRHALSSVQLFVERCLMNLETRVSPSSIKADRWEWMKRYRLWEANRKVFLWPENWLEPELRDDQSPFFRETMSELLQGDVTEDAASAAMLGYLSKLAEVAKLEPCAIHYFEGDAAEGDEVAHVIARTSGANRKYYYRRRDGASWTPWEEVHLQIGDSPVIPVVWKRRLFLFWTRVIPQPPDGQGMSAPSGGASLANADMGQLFSAAASAASAVANVKVQVMLCWSEFYNGRWQPEKTSDKNNPAELGDYPNAGQGAFDPSMVRLAVRELSLKLKQPEEPTQAAGSLFTVSVSHQEALQVSVSGHNDAAFVLYNTHGQPEVMGQESAPAPQRKIDTSDHRLSITYSPGGGGQLSRDVLGNDLDARVVEPRHALRDADAAPFFYEDSKHVFYVTTTKKTVKVQDHTDFGVPGPSGRTINHSLPPIYYALDPFGRIPKGDPVMFDGVETWRVNPADERERFNAGGEREGLLRESAGGGWNVLAVLASGVGDGTPGARRVNQGFVNDTYAAIDFAAGVFYDGSFIGLKGSRPAASFEAGPITETKESA